MKVLAFVLALMACPLQSLGYGDLVLTPRMSLSDNNKFAPSLGLLIDHEVMFVNYYSLTEFSPYPVSGNGYFYSVGTQQGIKFDAISFSLMPYYKIRHSFPEDFSRHELGVQFTYRLWR